MKKTSLRIISFIMLFMLLFSAMGLSALAEDADTTIAKTIEDFWQTDKQIVAKKTDTAPTIDGDGSDEAWANATAYTIDGSDGTDWVYKKNTWLNKAGTATIKFLWDDNALYILDTRTGDNNIHYSVVPDIDTQPNKNTGENTPTVTDGAIFGIEPIDSLPLEVKTFFFYQTLGDTEGGTTGGMRYRVVGSDDWNYEPVPDAIQYKATVADTEDGWTYETAIPWSVIRAVYPEFQVTAGTYMGLRASLYNAYTQGTGTYNAHAHFTAQSDSNRGNEENNFPILALADATGNIPDIDRSLEKIDIEYATDPEENVVEFDGQDPTNEKTGNAEGDSDGEGSKTNVALIIGLSVAIVAAIGAAVAVFILLKLPAVRIIAIVLAVVITAGCVIGMVKCGKTDGDSADGNSVSTEGVEVMPDSNIPADLTFGGKKVNILLREDVKAEFNPEARGEILDNAVLDRNAYVESRLDVTLNYISKSEHASGPYLDLIRNSISADDKAFDIITNAAYYAIPLGIEGLYYNLNSADEDNYIELDSAWYNQSYVNENRFKDKLFAIIGDATMTANDRAVVTFVNNGLLLDYKDLTVDTLINDVVMQGDWTLEYVKTLAKDVQEGDINGLVLNNGSMCIDSMLSAVNIRIIAQNENGGVEYILNSVKNNDRYAALYDLFHDGINGIFVTDKNDSVGEDTQYKSEQLFYDGQAMMAFGTLVAAKAFATQGDELSYGILPLPKYDKDQQGYYTTPQGTYSVMAILTNVSDVALATATVEYMSEESYRTIRPVYYETVYKVRYASDENTAQCFDMIINNIQYDFGAVHSSQLDNVIWHLRRGIYGTAGYSKELSTTWATYKKTLETTLDDLVAKYEEN